MKVGRLGNLLGSAFTPVVVAVVLGVTYWRLYYGVDFTDESFYVGVPYRLVLGAHPFVDETAVAQQLAGLLVYPFLRAYYAVAGLTGIVLFVRHLQFVFSLAVSLAVFFGLRTVLETRRAALVAVAAVAFVPFDIHSLSYNSLGGDLFTAGCFLGFRCLREPERRGSRFLAGLCHGLAAFAYPPLIGAVAACYLIRLRLARGPARRATIAYDLPGLALPLAGAASLVAWVGLHRFRSDIADTRTGAVKQAELHKIGVVAHHEWSTVGLWYLLIPALLLLALTWRRQRGVACVLLFALPLLVLPPKLSSYTASLEYVAHYGWLALPLFVVVRARAGAAELLGACWLPALIAGLTTGYSSLNGGVNAGIGFFPAAIVTSVFLIWSLDEASGTGRARLAVAPAVTVLAILIFFEAPVYRDGTLSTLGARIEHGAYAGLVTSSGKRAFLERLQRDLAGVRAPCRILFFNDFPAGYLLTSARPDTTSAWTFALPASRIATYQDAILRYYRGHGFPDVVVVMKRLPYAVPGGARIEHYLPDEPLLAMVKARPYRLVVARADYVIYSSGSCD